MQRGCEEGLPHFFLLAYNSRLEVDDDDDEHKPLLPCGHWYGMYEQELVFVE